MCISGRGEGEMKKRERILGHDPVSQLYRAVIRYVESRGGNVLVIGGVQVQEWPEESAYSFRIAVRCTGGKPTFAPLPEGRKPKARRVR